MKLIKTKTNIFLTSVAVISFFAISVADAGIIKINNYSRNRVEVDVVPEPSGECSSYCWKCLGSSLDSNTRAIKKIVIPANAFEGNEYFSVIGTEGGFVANGECKNLSVLKDYEVSFFETTAGLRCETKTI